MYLAEVSAVIVFISFFYCVVVACLQNLLQRHNHLDEEIKAFGQDVERLDQLAALMTKAATTRTLSTDLCIVTLRTVLSTLTVSTDL